MTEPTDDLLPRLRVRDLVASALLAVHTRPVRTLLTTIGVAIGIAAITGVLGISASSRADLLAELDSLGRTCCGCELARRCWVSGRSFRSPRRRC